MFRTRVVERASPGQTRNTDFPFHLGVVRLEVCVGDGQVGKAGSRNRADFSALQEINFMEAPIVGGKVHAGATDTAAVSNCALRFGFFRGSLAKGVWLKLGMVG